MRNRMRNRIRSSVFLSCRGVRAILVLVIEQIEEQIEEEHLVEQNDEKRIVEQNDEEQVFY